MQLKCFIIIFCHMYLPNINYHMKSLVCLNSKAHNCFSDVFYTGMLGHISAV